jgi:two-component system NarL family sensor kinase
MADGTLVLEIIDDGVGIGTPLEKPGGNDGIGLVSMRERALELGGTCIVEPAAGGGTRVYASLPLPQLDGA